MQSGDPKKPEECTYRLSAIGYWTVYSIYRVRTVNEFGTGALLVPDLQSPEQFGSSP